MLFACTSKIKEIPPEPWSSSPELYSYSWCTQGPSTGSTFCRTRGGEEDLHVLPKAGSFQPLTSWELPFVSCPLLSSILATQGSTSWLSHIADCWSPCSSSPVIITWCFNTLFRTPPQYCPQWNQPARPTAKTGTFTFPVRTSFWSRSLMC